jgi:hypothetical protein
MFASVMLGTIVTLPHGPLGVLFLLVSLLFPLFGAVGAWTFFTAARIGLFNGARDWDTETLKLALFLTAAAIDVSDTTYGALTNEVANSFGYTTGGQNVTFTISGTSTPIIDFAADPSWTASGGDIVFRHAVLYDASPDALVAFFIGDDAPADTTIADGTSLTVNPGAGGIFTATFTP